MRIILLKDVGGVGKIGDVKDIADGYALNKLIPHGLAAQATPDKLASHQKKMGEIVAQKEKEDAKLKEAINGLRGARVELTVKATEKGGLFKTIGPKEIGDAIKSQKNISLPVEAVKPLEPVKTTGDHIIKISALGAESEVMLKITAA